MTTVNEPSTSEIIHQHREASGRTALTRKTWSVPCRWLATQGHVLYKKSLRVLDYGCGYGKDVEELRGLGADAMGFDPVHCPEGGKHAMGTFDVVFCTHVLDTLPTAAERMFVVQGILTALRPGGVAYVTVRRDVPLAGWTNAGIYQDGSVNVAMEIGNVCGWNCLTCPSIHKCRSFEIYMFTKADS
jgi:SAM-dependent methyltransferase